MHPFQLMNAAERIFQEKYENFKSLLESDASQEEKLRAICNWGDSTNLVDCSGKQVVSSL